MILHSDILSVEERKIIHQDSLRILEEVGVKYSSNKALGILEDQGAIVNWDDKTAKIPRTMVERALKSAPSEVVLGARDPKRDFKMPSTYSGYTLDGSGSYIFDYKTKKRRPALLQDMVNSIRVFDEMDLGVIVWAPVVPEDVPIKAENTYSWAYPFMASSKHIQNEICNPKEVPYFIEILRAILGEDKLIKERKIASVVYCSVSPLVHEAEMLEGNIELTKYHVPILVYPMAGAGSTGPASNYSNIALTNAEALSSLVIFQMANPGTPVIFGAASSPIDFNTGACLEGAPEMALQTGAIGEMARFYNLPNICAGCLSDSKEIGTQAVLEKVLTTLPLVLSGADIVQGMGMFETSMTLSLEQIIVDNEIAHLCKRIREGVEVSKEKNYFDDIAKVGPGGHFLKAKSTRKAARSNEFYTSHLLDRNSYDTWAKLCKPDIYVKAHEKVNNILSSEQSCPVSKDTEKVLFEIMKEASKR